MTIPVQFQAERDLYDALHAYSERHIVPIGAVIDHLLRGALKADLQEVKKISLVDRPILILPQDVIRDVSWDLQLGLDCSVPPWAFEAAALDLLVSLAERGWTILPSEVLKRDLAAAKNDVG